MGTEIKKKHKIQKSVSWVSYVGSICFVIIEYVKKQFLTGIRSPKFIE